jgi:KUP system potassium uptake protein
MIGATIAGRLTLRRSPVSVSAGADAQSAAAAHQPAEGDVHALRGPRRSLAALTIGALGVVYGDLGTSPLYAVNQIFFGHGGVAVNPDNVRGCISLVLWALTIVVGFKYVLFVLRAHNDGEGGVFALYGLLHKYKRSGSALLLSALMLGAGLVFGDGMLTPAISVLAAVEGLEAATPAFAHAAVPLTVLILTALFAIQYKGSSGVGSVFGPVLICWFVMIGALGAWQLARHPEIVRAVNPLYGARFLHRAGLRPSLLVLGALMLVVTGGEALHTDMGHFGARPIRVGWFGLVYPALLLNYLGQGALLMSGAPVAGGKIFFSLAPRAMLLPTVALAAAATVIASQAMISGAFSLASQAMALGLFPRLRIVHTHHAHAGQIYMPFINWSLYIGCVVLVIVFRTSSALAAAYGLAVCGVMIVTTLAMLQVGNLCWKWGILRSTLLFGTLAAVDGSFLVASSLKFFEGGFIPLSLGAVLFLVMVTWRWGRKATFAAYSAKHTMTMGELVRLHRRSEVFLERNALLMVPKPLRTEDDHTPALLQLLWDRYGILPRNLIFIEVIHRKVPYVRDDRYLVTVFQREARKGSIISVTLSFGFMEDPNVERVLEELASHREIDLPSDAHKWIVHVSVENLLPSRAMTLAGRFRLRLFALLRHVSQPAHYYYGLGDAVQLAAEILPVRVR